MKAEDGTLKWKFSGTHRERKILCNHRLILTWPGRGGPVLDNGKLYFIHGIWPFMGVFVYALDATTGDVIWVNDRCDIPYVNQPHDSPAFAGIAPKVIPPYTASD